MKLHHFLSGIEHDRIHASIKAAEAGNSGDIVLYISHKPVIDPLVAANEIFRKFHLESSSSKNNLLIFIAPKTQKFAVVGGTALHEKVGQVWWDHLIGLLTRLFKAGTYTDGIIEALDEAGRALRTHFPATTVNRTGQKDIVEE